MSKASTAISSFEDSVAWQSAKSLTLEVYKLLKYCKDFGYKDQIQRASVSVAKAIETSRLIAGFIKALDFRPSTFDKEMS